MTARSSPWRSPDHAAISTSTRYREGMAAAAAATWGGDNRRSVTGRPRPIARRGVEAPRIAHGLAWSSPSATAVVIAARSSRYAWACRVAPSRTDAALPCRPLSTSAAFRCSASAAKRSPSRWCQRRTNAGDSELTPVLPRVGEMQVRSNPRYSSFVDSRAVGCSSIHCSTKVATEGDNDGLTGAFQVPRTRSACCRSSRNDASVREVNVVGAATYRASGPITRARNRPDGSRSTDPKARRDRLREAPPAEVPGVGRAVGGDEISGWSCEGRDGSAGFPSPAVP